MADFDNSTLSSAYYQVTKNFQDIEDRAPEWGGIKMFVKNPESAERIERLATPMQKPTHYRKFTLSATTGLGSLTCEPTSTMGDTDDEGISYTLYTGELVIPQKIQTENLYSIEQMVKRDMMNMWRGIYNQMEADAITAINAMRSQYNISVESTWNGATDYYNSLSYDNKDILRTVIKSEMRKAEYRDVLNMLYTAPYDRIFAQTDLQGSGNSTNYSNEDRNFNYYYTNSDLTLSGSQGAVYVSPVNSLASWSWVDPMYYDAANRNVGDKSWDITRDPVFGLPVGVFTNIDCDDSTSMGGAAQDKVTSVQYHTYLAFENATVSSPTNESPVHKYAVLDAT